MGHYRICFRALSSLLEKCFLPFLEEASTVTSPQTNEMYCSGFWVLFWARFWVSVFWGFLSTDEVTSVSLSLTVALPAFHAQYRRKRLKKARSCNGPIF